MRALFEFGEVARNQSLVEASLPPGGSTDRHLHATSEELYVILDGAGEMEIEGDRAPVAAGDVVLIPPGSRHQITATGDGAAPLPVLLLAALPPRGHDPRLVAVEIRIEPASPEAYELMRKWRYPPPYDFYDGDVDPPENPERFFAARDEDGELIGFYYFEPNPPDLDYGLGLRPDLTGRGLGLEFFLAGLRFARELYRPSRVYLHVAEFNERALPGLRARRLPRDLVACAQLRALRRRPVPDDGRRSRVSGGGARR